MKPCCNTHLVQHLKHWLLPSYVCWQHWIINFEIGNGWYRQQVIWSMDIEDMVNMSNGHRRCLVNGHWRICWILVMLIRVYPLLFQIPTLDTYPEFLIEQWFEVSIPDSNCYCSNIELRYLVYYCYTFYYYYTAPRQWVIAIVYCTKQ